MLLFNLEGLDLVNDMLIDYTPFNIYFCTNIFWSCSWKKVNEALGRLVDNENVTEEMYKSRLTINLRSELVRGIGNCFHRCGIQRRGYVDSFHSSLVSVEIYSSILVPKVIPVRGLV